MKKLFLFLLINTILIFNIYAQQDSIKKFRQDSLVKVNYKLLSYKANRVIRLDSLKYFKIKILDTIPFKILVKVDNKFTFSKMIDYYKMFNIFELKNFEVEKMYFIMLREYNKELIQSQNQRIEYTEITPNTILQGCYFIWFLNFSALQLNYKVPIVQIHGNAEVSNLRNAYLNGMLKFNSITRDTK